MSDTVTVDASPPGAVVEFCGERVELDGSADFTIGRDADLIVDDNPFLHRHFLQVGHRSGLWWLANVGTQLSATVADEDGLLQAWLAPGAALPLVFSRSTVWFTAGPTTYELVVETDDAPFFAGGIEDRRSVCETTTGRASFTPEQRLLLVALAEPMLRRGVRGAAVAPSSAEAAERLGWPLTKFNRKLDGVCQKLERLGVRGLHGEPTRLAASRKARLVEYALAARLVQVEDLDLLTAGKQK